MRFTLVLTLFTLIGYAADSSEDLLAAVRKGDLAAVKAFLDNGANVNAKSPYGATPLFFAADRGNIEMVKLLLQRGADVDVKDTVYGATASKIRFTEPPRSPGLLRKSASTFSSCCCRKALVAAMMSWRAVCRRAISKW